MLDLVNHLLLPQANMERAEVQPPHLFWYGVEPDDNKETATGAGASLGVPVSSVFETPPSPVSGNTLQVDNSLKATPGCIAIVQPFFKVLKVCV